MADDLNSSSGYVIVTRAVDNDFERTLITECPLFRDSLILALRLKLQLLEDKSLFASGYRQAHLAETTALNTNQQMPPASLEPNLIN